MKERLRIQEKKDRGEPRPWTKDEIFHDFRFCCVHRDDDRTSREAREIVEVMPDMMARCAAAGFRLYNRVSTLQALVEADAVASPNVKKIRKALSYDGPKVNANAYKIQPGKRLWNVEDITDRLARINKAIIDGWTPSDTAQETCVRLIKDFEIAGNFVPYQMMQDLRWVGFEYDDQDDWCLVGIGAHRGLKRLLGEYKPSGWQDRRHDESPVKKNLDIPPQYVKILREIKDACEPAGVPMDMFDVEHNVCEVDKYLGLQSKERDGRRYNPTKVKKEKKA